MICKHNVLKSGFSGSRPWKNIRVWIPGNLKTINDLRKHLANSGLINESVDFITTGSGTTLMFQSLPDDEPLENSQVHWNYAIYVHSRSNQVVINQLSGLSEESDRKCRELCEEMSALKASNESEVKALKAQLKSSEDSMHTMAEEINDLRQQLCSEKSNQEVVTDLSELLTKNIALSEELLAFKSSNESEVKTLKAELMSSMDSMETMVTENNNLKQMAYTLSQVVSNNMSNQNMDTDVKHKSKHTIESDIKLLAQEINCLNIRHSLSDSSSSCSSIGSHNQLTTN
ncbi:unnamed protein product [Medioppia subpectinata]|uniref:Uncharacterized protein n=1 Tax=Medioppia subpectinata TaxID=1979941 RepID=A0A7R9L5I6_9ACAR|nr:unnamed protein product [Medioppia subpectinata]CAG2115886.1 unnamed protein product [Medioppia subpectinata]